MPQMFFISSQSEVHLHIDLLFPDHVCDLHIKLGFVGKGGVFCEFCRRPCHDKGVTGAEI